MILIHLKIYKLLVELIEWGIFIIFIDKNKKLK